MKSLSILEIEEKLGKKIRRNTISLGWDVAMKYTGVCLLRTDNNDIHIEELDKIETDTKDDLKNRMRYFLGALDKFKQLLSKFKDYKMCVVEDSFMGQNVIVLKDLVRFSTLIWVVFHNCTDYLFFILPNSARSKIGFNKNSQLEETKLKISKISRGKNKGKNKKIDIKKLVQEYVKKTFNISIEDSDKCDSFVLAMCGILR
jgi:Holliday junction resolvasome RuvABC endonuclease subunit